MILTREEAEKIGKEQVAQQGNKYKFVRVGNLDECWKGHQDMKVYQKYKRLFVWRIDGAEFSDEIDEGGWTHTKKELLNDKDEFWFVVADEV